MITLYEKVLGERSKLKTSFSPLKYCRDRMTGETICSRSALNRSLAHSRICTRKMCTFVRMSRDVSSAEIVLLRFNFTISRWRSFNSRSTYNLARLFACMSVLSTYGCKQHDFNRLGTQPTILNFISHVFFMPCKLSSKLKSLSNNPLSNPIVERVLVLFKSLK
jgi:hypothetical protein